MEGTMITIVILLLIILAGGGFLYAAVRNKARQFSRMAFGTDSMLEGLREQEKRLASTPKSVTGMTNVYLPQIRRDFPEFSLPELVQKSENQLKAVLNAVERQDPGLLQWAAEDLQNQISLWISDDRKRGIREHFQEVKIHRTEISRYERLEGCCVITLQSAVEYVHWKEPAQGREAEPGRIQTRYDMEWMYVQDAAKLQSGGSAAAVVCPQCGAPVTNLGRKCCEYCGSAVEPVNRKVWSLNRIKECGQKV